jgi:hypothetical protein
LGCEGSVERRQTQLTGAALGFPRLSFSSLRVALSFLIEVVSYQTQTTAEQLQTLSLRTIQQ